MAANLLHAIELGLRRTGMTPSRFGREVARDPRLVFDLRRGRQLRDNTERRVRGYLAGMGRENLA